MNNTTEQALEIDAHYRAIDNLIAFMDSSIDIITNACNAGIQDPTAIVTSVNALALNSGIIGVSEQYLTDIEVSPNGDYTTEGFKSKMIRLYNKLVELAITAKNMVMSLIRRLFNVGAKKEENVTSALSKLDKSAAISDEIMDSESIAPGTPWTPSALTRAASAKIRLVTDNNGNAVRSNVAFADMSPFCGQTGDVKKRTIHALAHNGQLVSIQSNIKETLLAAREILANSDCEEIYTVIRAFSTIRKEDDIEKFIKDVIPRAIEDNEKRLGNFLRGKEVVSKSGAMLIKTKTGRPMCGGALGGSYPLNFGLFKGRGFKLITQPDLYPLTDFSINFDTYQLPNNVKAKSLPTIPRKELESIMAAAAELSSMAKQFEQRLDASSGRVANFIKSGDILADLEGNITKAAENYRHASEVKSLIAMVNKVPTIVRAYSEVNERMAAYCSGLHTILVTLIEDCVDNAVDL